MRRFIAILVLLLPPLALLGFGWQLTADRDAVLQMQLRQLVDARLEGLDGDIHRWLMEQIGGLEPLATIDKSGIAELQRSRSLIRQIHVLSRDGQWRYPEQGRLENLSPETVFAALADEANSQRPAPWARKGSFSRYAPAAEVAGESADIAPEPGRRGWLVRYQQQQLQLLRWVDSPNGDVWLFEVSYPALLAGLIGWLPDTNAENSDSDSTERYRLADGSGRQLYGWGGYVVDEKQTPQAQLTLRSPLSGWHIDYFSEAAAANSLLERLRWLLIAAVVAVLTLLLGLWLWRKQQAELRLAEQRVSFVNQVSHELKTPLTNIRLYAELLQQKIGDQPVAKRQLGVVVSESQRLSRLINNVLSFGRGQRKQLQIQRRPAVVDEVVEEVLANWEIALADSGIEVSFVGNAAREVSLDIDALEQILNNLISNAEKYAAAGGTLKISSELDETTARLLISDAGPGIPPAERQQVFESFYRRSDNTTEGVSGTGIGLGLARELARLHGGDLVIVDDAAADQGCCFELSLEVGQ